MTDASGQGASNINTTPFSRVFQTIVGGYETLGKIADGGASGMLLSSGAGTLVATTAVEIISVLESPLTRRSSLATGDLAVLVAGSVVLMLVGSGLRVLDRVMSDKASERDARLRIDAAEKAAVLLTGAAPAKGEQKDSAL